MSEEKLNQYLKEEKFPEALSCCNELIEGGHKNHSLLAVKGWCLHKMGKSAEGQPLIVDAFKHSPSNQSIATIAISFYMDFAAYEQVIAACQRALAFHPKDDLMWHRLGTSHYLIDEIASSLIAFRQCLDVKKSARSLFGMSQPLLTTGQYKQGFQYYEYRFQVFPQLNWIKCEKMPMPQWKGEPLKGKTILIWSEQGLGDSIQFARLSQLLVEQGASVDLFLQPQHRNLAEILVTIPWVQSVTVIKGNEVVLSRRYDFQSPIMSLMGYLGINDQNIPATVPYISLPEKNHITLPEKPKNLKVAITWSTLLTDSLKRDNYMHYVQKKQKSLLMQELETLFALFGCTFYSMQLSLNDKEKRIADKYSVVDMSQKIKNFTDTAAIIEKVDLVISIDTSTVHLAGAMGKPTINLLPYHTDWRWQQNRDDSPWYPTMRLFRQVNKDDWKPTVQRLEKAVKSIVHNYQKNGEVRLDLPTVS